MVVVRTSGRKQEIDICCRSSKTDSYWDSLTKNGVKAQSIEMSSACTVNKCFINPITRDQIVERMSFII